jgi:hypothetical protein
MKEKDSAIEKKIGENKMKQWFEFFFQVALKFKKIRNLGPRWSVQDRPGLGGSWSVQVRPSGTGVLKFFKLLNIFLMIREPVKDRLGPTRGP